MSTPRYQTTPAPPAMTPFATRGEFAAWAELQPVHGSFSVIVGRQLYWFDDSAHFLYRIDPQKKEN